MNLVKQQNFQETNKQNINEINLFKNNNKPFLNNGILFSENFTKAEKEKEIKKEKENKFYDLLNLNVKLSSEKKNYLENSFNYVNDININNNNNNIEILKKNLYQNFPNLNLINPCLNSSIPFLKNIGNIYQEKNINEKDLICGFTIKNNNNNNNSYFNYNDLSFQDNFNKFPNFEFNQLENFQKELNNINNNDKNNRQIKNNINNIKINNTINTNNNTNNINNNISYFTNLNNFLINTQNNNNPNHNLNPNLNLNANPNSKIFNNNNTNNSINNNDNNNNNNNIEDNIQQKIRKNSNINSNSFEEILSNENKIDDKYKTELCKKWTDLGYCPYGNKCRFAHGKCELVDKIISLKKKYKQKECVSFHKSFYCKYGVRCQFKHFEKNLNEIERSHYYNFLRNFSTFTPEDIMNFDSNDFEDFMEKNFYKFNKKNTKSIYRDLFTKENNHYNNDNINNDNINNENENENLNNEIINNNNYSENNYNRTSLNNKDEKYEKNLFNFVNINKSQKTSRKNSKMSNKKYEFNKEDKENICNNLN
jgi:hypothetical protein